MSESCAPDGPVLVIEDEEVVRNVACRMLEAIGRKAVGASDGAAGVAAARDACPSAVLLDLTLPDMAAGDVLGEVRKACPDAFIVLTSGYEEEAVTQGLDIGDAPFLAKPFALKDLEHHFGCAS